MAEVFAAGVVQSIGVEAAARVLTPPDGAKEAMKLSVVIPVYNEREFIEEVLARVQAADGGGNRAVIAHLLPVLQLLLEGIGIVDPL